MIGETIRLAIQAILRNALRSLLTVLGVVIGVAAVIAMVTIGKGSSDQVTASVASLGTNVLILRPGRAMMGPGLRDDAPAFRLADAEALGGLSVVKAAAPVASSTLTAVYGNANSTTLVTGSDMAYLDVLNWPVVRGRGFTQPEERSGAAVCLIGESVRQKLFGNTDPTGETIRLKSVSCEVVGLLQVKGASTFGQDQDDTVIAPVRMLQRRISGNSDVSSIRLALAPGVTTDRGIRTGGGTIAAPVTVAITGTVRGAGGEGERHEQAGDDKEAKSRCFHGLQRCCGMSDASPAAAFKEA